MLISDNADNISYLILSARHIFIPLSWQHVILIFCLYFTYELMDKLKASNVMVKKSTYTTMHLVNSFYNGKVNCMALTVQSNTSVIPLSDALVLQ